MAGSGKV